VRDDVVSSPWQSSGPDPAVRRLAVEGPAEIAPQRSPLRDPARAIAVVGALLAIVTSPLPWLTRVGNPPPAIRTGWSSTADGFLVAVVAVVLLFLAMNRTAGAARSRGLRLLPALLGALAAVLGFGATRALENQVAIWTTEGATGVYEPWFSLHLVGAALAAVGGLWLGIRRGLEPSPPGDPTDRIGLTRAGVASTALGAIGVVLGAIAVALLVLNSGLNDVAMSVPLLFGILTGGLFGGYVGSWFSRMLFPKPGLAARPRDEGIRLEKVSTTIVSPRERYDRGERDDADDEDGGTPSG
jgi:hypothetical protein